MSGARPDLEDILREQIGFLERSNAAYDEGYYDEAKRIAVVVRVLLHDTQSSHSLFQQLSYKNYKFLDTSPNVDSQIPGKIFQAGLAIPSLKGYVPRHQAPQLHHPSWSNFTNWWNNPVINTQERTYSRRELVLILANKEGGAHVDPKLTAHYENLKNKGSGFTIIKDGSAPKRMTQEEHACLRQIAYELLETIKHINSGDAPEADQDMRPLVFRFPVYLFIKAEPDTPIGEIELATIQKSNNLLPVFDNESDAKIAETMLRGDYKLQKLGKNGFIRLLKYIALPKNIENLTFNPDAAGEGQKYLPIIPILSLVSDLERDYTDGEVEDMLKNEKFRRV